MDREFAIRLVVFEYLLPLQRAQRVRVIDDALHKERVDASWTATRHPAGIFEELHWLSEQLLHSQGFPTSYTYPYTMWNEATDRRKNVKALVDSRGPFVWDPTCTRPADPLDGIRVFRSNRYMSAGRL